jgi:SAM-dependent methyltransferase
MISYSVRSAVAEIYRRFPFQGYFNPESGGHELIGATVQKYLKPGARILDVGCGPCDKTAVLQLLGYHCVGFDDFRDRWHEAPGMREKIFAFAIEQGIELHVAEKGKIPFDAESFDMVTLNDVIEHLHESPRELLNDLIELIKSEGLLFITVPNAVNIRKRLDVLRGRTNLPPYDSFYWYPGDWRGHVREYVEGDLRSLSEYLGMEVVELRACDQLLTNLPAKLRRLYLAITGIFPSWKDSWLFLARKPKGWVARRAPAQSTVQTGWAVTR